MKSLFFTSLLALIFSAAVLPASAQLKFRKHKKEATQAGHPVKFIDGIEINKQAQAAVSLNTPEKTTVSKSESTATTNSIEKSSRLQFKYGQLLNRNVEEINNMVLFNYIEEWWGIPYHFGGNDKTGIDCSGFSCSLFNHVYGMDIPRTAREQFNACEKIEAANMNEGDLVFFNTSGGVSHVGIYLGDGYFVHASTTNGITINNLTDDYYSARFLGGGRMVKNDKPGEVMTVGSR